MHYFKAVHRVENFGMLSWSGLQLHCAEDCVCRSLLLVNSIPWPEFSEVSPRPWCLSSDRLDVQTRSNQAEPEHAWP